MSERDANGYLKRRASDFGVDADLYALILSDVAKVPRKRTLMAADWELGMSVGLANQLQRRSEYPVIDKVLGEIDAARLLPPPPVEVPAVRRADRPLDVAVDFDAGRFTVTDAGTETTYVLTDEMDGAQASRDGVERHATGTEQADLAAIFGAALGRPCDPHDWFEMRFDPTDVGDHPRWGNYCRRLTFHYVGAWVEDGFGFIRYTYDDEKMMQVHGVEPSGDTTFLGGIVNRRRLDGLVDDLATDLEHAVKEGFIPYGNWLVRAVPGREQSVQMEARMRADYEKPPRWTPNLA
ncbi:hypothetical protein [Tsukamurella soli]